MSDMSKLGNHRHFNTKELSLIAIFASVWITSQLYLGPIVGRLTTMHGMVERVVGWLLMVILAKLTGRFGRVSIMTAIATLVTRLIRVSALEGLVVGLGYALGGLTFDLMFFAPLVNNFQGKTEKAYLLTIAIISGGIAFIPYLVLTFSLLGLYGFIAWIPLNVYRLIKDIVLSGLGVFLGLLIIPQIKGFVKERIVL